MFEIGLSLEILYSENRTFGIKDYMESVLRSMLKSNCVTDVYDVTSKVGDHVKIDEASPFFLVNLCQHQNKKTVMSTIMKTMIFSSFLCIFSDY